MAKSKEVPTLTLMHDNNGKSVVKCSCGEEIKTEGQVDSLLDLQSKAGKAFNAHVRERHPSEDINQAAARIVREATERG